MTDQPKYKSIDMTCRMGAPENPTFPDARGWTITLEYGSMSAPRHAMQLPFYMGSAHRQTPPTLEDVLCCLFSDDPQGESWEEWMSNFWGGAEEATWAEWQNRKATYDACVLSASQLRGVLGDDFETIRAEIEGLEL